MACSRARRGLRLPRRFRGRARRRRDDDGRRRDRRAFNTLGWENFADPPPGAALFFAADPSARQVAEELISAVGLEPDSVGDAEASSMVDALLPLWFSLVRHNGGNRRVALRIVR